MLFEVQSTKGLLPLPLPGEGLVHYQVSGAHTPPSPPPQVSPTYQNPIIFSALMLWCHPCRGGYMGIWSCEIWFKFWTWQTTVARWQWVAGETIGAGGASSCRSSCGSSRKSRSTTTLTSSTSTLSTYCWWNNGAGQDSSWDWGAACSRHWGWIQPLSTHGSTTALYSELALEYQLFGVTKLYKTL